MMRTVIEVTSASSPKDRGRSFVVDSLHKQSTIIGRDPALSCRIHDPRVSMIHCEILFKRRCFWVRDLRSSNGTFLEENEKKEVLHPYNKRRLNLNAIVGLGSARLTVTQLVDASTLQSTNKRLTLAVQSSFGEKKKKGKLTFKIDETGATVGRSSQNAIHLPFQNVSSQHCMVSVLDGDYAVSDLGSSNGTFLNNERLEKNEPQLLTHGDVIRLASKNSTEFVCNIETKKKPTRVASKRNVSVDFEKEMEELAYAELRDNLLFDEVLENEAGINAFEKFLMKCFNEENILFWKEVQVYKKISSSEKRKAKADEMFHHFVKVDSEMELNVDIHQRDRVFDALEGAELSLFDDLEEIILQLLRFDSHPKFILDAIGKEYYVREVRPKKKAESAA